MDQTELVGVREAARKLGLNASTISRHLAKHPVLIRSRDAKGYPLIDPDEVSRHRNETINPAKSGNHAGRMYGDEVEEDGECESHSQPAQIAAPVSTGPSLAEERAGYESLRRRREEIKFAAELRQLSDVADVEDAAREIGGLLQREIDAVFGSDFVARIRKASDDRRALAEVESAKDELFKRIDHEASQSLSRLAGGSGGEGDGADPEE